MVASLPGRITAVSGAPATMRVGKISSTTPLVLTVQGATFSGDAVGVLGSYVPGLGDTVTVVGQSKTQGSDPSSWLILGASVPFTDSGPVPQVRAYQTGAQATADGVAVAVTFQAQNWDTHEIHSTTVNPSRFTVPIDGRYSISSSVSYSINATGRRSISLRINGGAAIIADVAYQAVSGSFTMIQNHAEADLMAGDYVEAYALQFSGGALNTLPGEQFTWLSLRWMNASIASQ